MVTHVKVGVWIRVTYSRQSDSVVNEWIGQKVFASFTFFGVKRVKRILKNERMKSCSENVQDDIESFWFFQVRVQFEAYILLSKSVVSARATAFSSSAAISMPPVPVVAMLAVRAFVHPNVVSFIAPWVGSNSSLESVFGTSQANCFLLTICWIFFTFWVRGVRFSVFCTQFLWAFFHASIPRLWLIACLAICNAIISLKTLVLSHKANVFLSFCRRIARVRI